MNGAPPDLCVIHITCPDRVHAERCAEALISGEAGNRCAACVTILPEAWSCYEWDGAIHRTRECIVMVKTTRARSEACIAQLVGLHPDEVPGFFVLPVIGGHPPFLAWVAGQVGAD